MSAKLMDRLEGAIEEIEYRISFLCLVPDVVWICSIGGVIIASRF